MEPKSPQYQHQNQRHYQKIKLKVSISDKYTCKISQQNIKKPNLTHIKKIIHYDQFGFIPGDKDGSTHTNQCEISDQQRKYNHMKIWKDAEKAFDVIQHLFIIKYLKLDIEETYFYIIKLFMTNLQPILYSIVKSWRTSHLKYGTRQECPFLPLLFHIVLEVLATAIRQEKEIKGTQIRRE